MWCLLFRRLSNRKHMFIIVILHDCLFFSPSFPLSNYTTWRCPSRDRGDNPRKYTPPSQENHLAFICDIIPSGMQKVPYSSKKRPHFPVFKRKKHSMENILQKPDLTVGKLQMQVDDLIETVTDKSMKLLAQRHAELQHCEFLGDEVLKSSKQFQRMSKRTMRKYKLKNQIKKWKHWRICGVLPASSHSIITATIHDFKSMFQTRILAPTLFPFTHSWVEYRG